MVRGRPRTKGGEGLQGRQAWRAFCYGLAAESTGLCCPNRFSERVQRGRLGVLPSAAWTSSSSKADTRSAGPYARPGTRTPPCRSSRPPSSPRKRSWSRTSRGSATSTRCSRSSRTLASRSAGATSTRCRCAASSLAGVEIDSEPAEPHPGLVPGGGPIAGARGRGPHGAARRRLHRPASARPAPRRLPARWARRSRVDRSGYRMSAAGGLRACEFFMDEASVMATENGLMAAALTPGTTTIRNAASGATRAGPRAAAGRDGRPYRRHRVERAHGARQGAPGRRPALDCAGSHRGRELHGPGGRHRRRAAHRRHGPRRHEDDPHGVRPPWAALRAARRRAAGAA